MPSLTPTMGGSVLWPETTVLSGPFVRFSLFYNRILWVITIGFPLSDVPSCDFSRVSIERIYVMVSLPAGSGIVRTILFLLLIIARDAARFFRLVVSGARVVFFGLVLSLRFFSPT